VAAALEGRPLTIRTLDIGGDKPIPYLPLPREDNPALGLRGVRTSLWKPELFAEQLQAILAVEPASQCRILVPMITDLSELSTVRGLIEQACATLPRLEPVPLGVMIETPAAALLADQLAQAADFLSIGTNDLTQYTLAMDRGHPELAPRIDALHPAVLRLIARVAEAGRGRGLPVAVCGALAGDPEAVPILVGLGVNELSVVPAFIPRLKAQLASLNLRACEALAREALAASSAQEVRALTRAPETLLPIAAEAAP
jgi:phosphoenolpyruvate-protein kinase (PTS system EI component)